MERIVERCCGRDVGPKTVAACVRVTAPNRGATNYTLSYLNQYWRLKSKDEAVLFGRLTRVKGPAEGVSQGGSSPSRLWLGSLPGSGQRSPLSGELAQDTYVRVFIPVSNPWAPLP